MLVGISIMSVVSMILAVFFWIVVILLCLLILAGIVIRVVRRFVKSPTPAFLVSFMDNPVRRWIQPPTKVVGWMSIEEGMQVLELGPGSGIFTVEASRLAGETGRVFAVDIQPGVISKLNGRLRREGVTNVVGKVASAYELPLPSRSIDRAFMITVLPEVPDPRKALVEIRRVLKDDGLLAIGEFLPDPDYPRRRTVVRWCRDAGFDLVEGYGGVLHYLLVFELSQNF